VTGLMTSGSLRPWRYAAWCGWS